MNIDVIELDLCVTQSQSQKDFDLNLCVTQSQQSQIITPQLENIYEIDSRSSFPTRIHFNQLALDDEHWANNPWSQVSDLTQQTFDTYSKEEEKEICLFVFAESLKQEKKLKYFQNKMQARRRFGYANIIKRAICQKGLWRKSTTALRLWKLTLIQNKLKRKKSLYY